nr:ribonuclease H-like domain-containing protein [Tanacetum cinerariifolium]
MVGFMKVQLERGDKEVMVQDMVAKVVMEVGSKLLGDIRTARPRAVNTARPRAVNTARPRVVNSDRPNSTVVNVVRANRVNAIKASACWVWRPTKPNGNMSYLSDFKEFDGGYVTFRGEANSGELLVKELLKQNRALVVKPHNKTLYELFRGRIHALSIMRPFGCHATILNTFDHLGKFDGKANEGYFVGYYMNSKAFRVYNIQTRRVEENLHIEFLENKPIVVGAGPEWLFDIDILTKSINYVLVIAGTNSDDFVGTKDNIGTDQSNMETGSTQDYIFMLLWKDGSPLFDSSLIISGDAGKKHDKVLDKESEASNELNYSFKNLNTEYLDDPKMFSFETIATNDYSKEEADFTNLESSIHVSPTPTTKTHMNHPLKQEELLQFKLQKVWVLVDFSKGKKAIGFMVYQMDVKSAFLYRIIEEEIYVCQHLGFEDPDHPDKELCTKFERLMKHKFQMGSMGEHTFFLGLQVKQKEDGLFISQHKYVVEVLRKFSFSDVKSAVTPPKWVAAEYGVRGMLLHRSTSTR